MLKAQLNNLKWFPGRVEIIVSDNDTGDISGYEVLCIYI